MPQYPVEPDYNLLYYWRILVQAKRMILFIVVTALGLTAVYTKTQPKLYESKVVLLPAREESISGVGMASGGGVRGGGGGGGGGGGASGAIEALGGKGSSVMDSLTSILVSRTMAEAVAEDLNLVQYFGVGSLRKAAHAVRGELDVKTTKYKSLEIVIVDQDPQMAAQIANTYAKMLDKMNKDLTITATKRVRHYVEGRLAEKAKALADAENAVKKFQDENRVRLAVEGSEGVQNDLSMIGGMASQILGLEVELAGLKEYAQPNHPMVIQMEAQIRELRRQVDRIERETVRGGSGQDRKRLVPLSRKFVPSFEETTSLNFEMQTLARRLKVEEMIHGSLVSMLESAKLAEARDLPTVQVLDSALPPEGPSKPNMLYNLMAAGGLSLVFAIFLTVFLDYLDRLRVEERERALAQVATEMVSPSVEGSNGNGLGTVVYPSATGEAERLRG